VKVKKEDIIEEGASAKRSSNRPIFDEMLFGFKNHSIFDGWVGSGRTYVTGTTKSSVGILR
jgi:hypothetical protein